MNVACRGPMDPTCVCVCYQNSLLETSNTNTNLLLNRQLHFNSLGMWLCPNKTCINQSNLKSKTASNIQTIFGILYTVCGRIQKSETTNLAKSFEFLQADCQQLPGLQCTADPIGRRLQIPGHGNPTG